MRISRGLASRAQYPHPVLTIGNFDGPHRGHLELLREVVAAAAAVEGTSIVLTFDPHPLRILKPEIDLRFLISVEEKLSRFREVGIQEVIFLEFNATLAALSPEAFVFKILRDGIGARDLFVGEAFAFGKNREGHLSDLRQWAQAGGFRVHPVPAVRIDGEIVSSSRIRHLIQSGEVRAAAKCLGRHYALSGPVVRGEQRGRALGWPTANLVPPQDRVIPADGVYVARARYDARQYDAVAYVGTRPTFGKGQRLLEAYLLGEGPDLYGEELSVEFVERLRGDMTFATPEELSARIEQDVQMAREHLRSVGQSLMETGTGQSER